MHSRIILIGLSTFLSFSLARNEGRAQTDATAPPIPSLATPAIQRDSEGVVTLSSTEPDVLLAYTLDGSPAKDKSGRYLAPVSLANGGTVSAVALSTDRKQSSSPATVSFMPLPGLVPLPSSLVPVTQERSFPIYDWAKRHAELVAEVSTKNPQILFIGDSITHRLARDPLWKERYEPMGATNLGFGWDRIENVLWRVQHGELDGAKPKVVVLLIGTNNLEKNSDVEIAVGIQTLCAEIHERLPAAKILLLGIFPRGKEVNPLRARIANINQLVATLDGQNNLTFLDFGAKFLEADGSISPEIMGDSLHPSPKGYGVWAEAMEPTLKSLMQNP